MDSDKTVEKTLRLIQSSEVVLMELENGNVVLEYSVHGLAIMFVTMSKEGAREIAERMLCLTGSCENEAQAN